MAKAITQKRLKAHPGAWIVNPKDKGRKKIQKGNVYLKDGEEFMIELHNPLKKCVLADIRINGESISENGLMIRPGQREYLDCFINSKKKLVFRTYDVDITLENMEAIKDNGSVEIFFYKEETVELKDWTTRYPKIIREYYPWYVPYTPYTPQPIWYSTTGAYGYSSDSSSTIGSQQLSSSNTGSLENFSYSVQMETGRVENGEESEQKFRTVDMDFEENYIHHITYKLLPESRKPAELEINKKKMEQVSKTKSEEIVLIEKLASLYDAGILTEKEFKDKKKELLSRI